MMWTIKKPHWKVREALMVLRSLVIKAFHFHQSDKAKTDFLPTEGVKYWVIINTKKEFYYQEKKVEIRLFFTLSNISGYDNPFS